MTEQSSTGVLFFDGLCGTCNTIVDFLLRVDTAGKIRYAPLQGSYAARELSAADVQDLQTLVFRTEQGEILRRSSAMAAIFALLPLPWRLVALIRFVPAPLRDFFYNLYARNRYILGGKRESCRMPTAAERDRFFE